jgi:hypothetical protein
MLEVIPVGVWEWRLMAALLDSFGNERFIMFVVVADSSGARAQRAPSGGHRRSTRAASRPGMFAARVPLRPDEARTHCAINSVRMSCG